MHGGVLVTTTNQYAPTTGLLQSIVRNGETTVYSYDNLHRLSSIEIAGKNKQAFTYDAYDRIVRTEETIGAKTFTTETEYDALGRVKRHLYPSDFYTTNWYDVNGLMTEVTDASNRSIWKALEYNAKGQLKRELRGGRETVYNYDTRGFTTGISVSGIINQTYQFSQSGNLEYRQDGLYKEAFTYDAQQRLTNWNVHYNNQLVQSNGQTYDPLTGNIAIRSALGDLSMIYSLNGPHSLDTIKGMPSTFPTDNLNVTYTDFSKIASLSEGNKLYTLTYGVDDQRRKSVYQVGGITQQTRYYLGDYEEEVDAAGNVRKIHYLSGGAVLIRNNGQDSLLYCYSDYLGSLIALTNEEDSVVGRYAYDPWGNRRNPDNWTQTDNRTHWLLNRGYTMHEHLDAYGIINMNGRVYDPLTAQFFSPDPFVQAPGSWLNYNRYGYCYNNPFRYTDPDGEWIHIVIGAAIGGIINVAVHWNQIDGLGKGLVAFGIGALGGAAAAATGGAVLASYGTMAGAGGFVSGAAAGGFGYSFGTVATSTGNNLVFGDPMPTEKQFLTGLGVSMLTGGIINGTVSAANDGNFWKGPKTTQRTPTTSTTTPTKKIEATKHNTGTQQQGQNSHVNNTVPEKVVRVVPDNSTHPQLGYEDDVFVTAAEDIKGLNALQISDRLGIELPPPGYGYRAYEFPTPNGISSPIVYENPLFVGRGLTIGGAREFNIPNMNINNIQGLTIFRIYF